MANLDAMEVIAEVAAGDIEQVYLYREAEFPIPQLRKLVMGRIF